MRLQKAGEFLCRNWTVDHPVRQRGSTWCLAKLPAPSAEGGADPFQPSKRVSTALSRLLATCTAALPTALIAPNPCKAQRGDLMGVLMRAWSITHNGTGSKTSPCQEVLAALTSVCPGSEASHSPCWDPPGAGMRPGHSPKDCPAPPQQVGAAAALPAQGKASVRM